MAVEEKSKVNWFLWWAVYNAMEKFAKDSTTHITWSSINAERKNILMAMIMWEREIDDDYLEKYYNPHMSLLNCGGLTLIHSLFLSGAKGVYHQ